MSNTLSIPCPAKVNLALSVGAPRPDGYHPIASWMTTISLADQLTIESSSSQSSFNIDWAPDAPQTSPIDWPIQKDLAFRAHKLLESHTGRLLPIRATLTKRIPVGAGLAGGSTDGAAMFKALNHCFNLNIDNTTLIDLSMQLGSDLAFFFSSGSAIVTGRGEHLDEVPMPRSMHLALILPDFGCPTGAVYRAFDDLAPTAQVDESAVRQVAAGQSECFNDLAKAACAVQPRLALLQSQIAALTGRTVHVTGSGAGMFIQTPTAAEAHDLTQKIRNQTGSSALAVAVG